MAGGLLILLLACAPEGEWVTPLGVPLGTIDCTSPAPLDDRMRNEVCRARLIENTPEEISRCERQGGSTGPVSSVDRRFACTYGDWKPAKVGEKSEAIE